MNHSLLLSGPSSLGPGSPEGTRGRARGLKDDATNDLDWTEDSGRGTLGLELTRQEEGVMLVPGWVLLRLEQRVKVPERAFYEVVGRHLAETVRTKKKEVTL